MKQGPAPMRQHCPGAELIRIPGGRFVMGSDRFYPEEAPSRTVEVSPFLIERTAVTNAAFAAFVGATGYITLAERTPRQEDYPDAPAHMLQPASMVFQRPAGPVGLDQPARWWRLVRGADWRRPYGPDGPPAAPDEPVVHIALCDAEAYASWAGLRLPTEAEWEFAARGGLDGADYAWGDQLVPEGKLMANTWFGTFPHENLSPAGFAGVAPVGSFEPNGYGLYDMIGNVWEWTADFYAPHGRTRPPRPCCVPKNPRNRDVAASIDPRRGSGPPRAVLKGGSFLCAENYCRRYRPAARHPQDIDTGASHIGFRCARDEQPAVQIGE